MNWTDDLGQSPRHSRKAYTGNRDNGANPVVRTAPGRAYGASKISQAQAHRADHFANPVRKLAQSRLERHVENEIRNTQPQEPTFANAPKPILDLNMVLGGLWKYRGLAGVLMVICAVGGAAVMPLLPKKYSAETSIYFDPHSVDTSSDGNKSAAQSPESVSATIESQTRILTSRVIMKRVAERLDLGHDPEFAETSVQPAGSMLIPGEVLDKLADGAESKRDPNSYVVGLRFTAKNPQKSADIANAIVQEFVAEETANINGLYSTANTALDGRVAQLADSVQKADQAVEDYKAKNDLVTADGNLISDKRLVSLNESLLTAQNKTIEAKARVDFVAKLGIEATGNEKDVADSTSAELSNLLRQYSEQIAKVGSLKSQLGARHPALQAAQASLDGIKGQVQAEQDRTLSKAKAQLQQAQQTEAEIEKQLNLQKALQSGSATRLVELKELQRKAEAMRTIYESVLKRAGETGEQNNVGAPNVRVISEALPPVKANGPAKNILMIAGGFGGLLLGLVLAILFSLVMTMRSALKPVGNRPYRA